MRDRSVIQGALALLLLTSLPFSCFAQSPTSPPKGIEGIWQGALDVGTAKLRLVLHIEKGTDGALKGSLDSPDQQAFGLPVDSVTLEADKLRAESKKLGAVYEGTVDAQFENIKGKFTQSGQAFPLNLVRVEKAPKPAPVIRPQVPKPPYPYDAKDVVFQNKSAGVSLAGTLTTPKTGGPFPAVILISGSGANRRDEEIFNHPIFRVLADYLTRRGFAVLRYDKRGIGQSTGKYVSATTTDFASDALAGVNYLKSLAKIDHQRIGMIGHSEGGLIAPMVAAQSKDVKFIVMMAGPGIDGGRIMSLQSQMILEAEGVPKAKVQESVAVQKRYLDAIRNSKDSADLKAKIEASIAKEMETLTPEQRNSPAVTAGFDQKRSIFNSPWIKEFVTLDPVIALKKVKCPVLALNGEKDLQVPYKANLPVIEAALMAAHNKDFTVKALPDLNHLFQPCKTGSPSEYGEIQTTISPKALSTIADWLKLKAGK